MSQFDNEVNKFKEVAEALNRHVSESVVTLNESTFVSKLLPIMQQWVVDKNGENIHLWAIAANGIERPIRVKTVDGFFMVPPPYNHLSNINARSNEDNQKLHALNQLIRMKQMDGETREAMKLSGDMERMIDTNENVSSLAKYTVQLAKIWKRYNLPLEQVLSDVKINLDNYDEYGDYILTEENANVSSGNHEEDELEW